MVPAMMALRNGVQALALCLATLMIAAGACVDQDDVLGPLMQQQFGRKMTCAEVIVRGERICDDAIIHQLCCGQCSLHNGDGRRSAWTVLAEAQAETRRQLLSAPKIALRGGAWMPSLALGTAQLTGEAGALAIEFALRSGYRALDTALMYENHRAVSKGIRQSGLPRADVFLTSKIPPEMQGFVRASDAVAQMLAELETAYVDLCLVHWPMVVGGSTDAYVIVERAGTWRALEAAHRNGQCRHLGVSNYMPEHLDELLDFAEVAPAVNQIEYHPYQVDSATANFCRMHGIAVQSYGSIGTRGLMTDDAVVAVAKEVQRSPGQVLLRWGLQQGTMVLPRSSKETRILENARLWDFELTLAQQERLTALHTGHRSYDDPYTATFGDYKHRRPWSRWRGIRNTSATH